MIRRFGWLVLLLAAPAATAGDNTWTNTSGNFSWDTSASNWTTPAVWNNANGDGAIFGNTGLGTITVNGPVSVNSMSFTADGYILQQPNLASNTITFVTGTSTQTTGVVNVASGINLAVLDNPISSAVGFQKVGAGRLTLSQANTFGSTAISLTSNGNLKAGLQIGAITGTTSAGTLAISSQSGAAGAASLPSGTAVGIGPGLLDIQGNNIVLAGLTFTNNSPNTAWNSTLRVAGSGVVSGTSSGSLQVNGDINVIGVALGGGNGNSIGVPVNLGGGTQVIRVGSNGGVLGSGALMFNSPVSNGSILKTIGYTQAGIIGSVDGIGLFANNTYTGSTVLNGGTNVITGTNATASVKVVGRAAGAATSSLAFQGASGSALSAATVSAFAGGSIILDNNAALGASGNNQPNIAAAQNNDRLSDTAAVQLRDGFFIDRGLSGAAATETVGSLAVQGGYNAITLTPNGGGSVVVTVAGNLTLASRATLVIQPSGTGITLGTGGTAQLKVGGTVPTADATGIIPRIASNTDLLTYSTANGFTPYTTYAADFNTAGANVALSASTSVPAGGANINGLKTTGAITTTIAAGDTLTVASGMLVSSGGTHTISGGTLAFGATPGVFFGAATVNSAVTGTNGLIVANGAVALAGDLTGLTGSLTVQNGTATLSGGAANFTGPIDVRAGTLAFSTSQTGVTSAITLGVSANDSNLYGLIPTFDFSGAGANATISRNIVVDNGALTAAGVSLSASLVTRFNPLSNSTGSQTLTGNVTLNTDVNLQGGGGSGTGATIFTGSVTGAGRFIIPNGRATFSGAVSNTGGFLISSTGFTAQVSFTGTASGSGPITVNGGNSTTLSYAAGALPGGPLTVQGSSSSTAPTIIPLATSSISNTVTLSTDAIVSPGSGVNATWAGAVSGAGPLTKSGTGTLTLSATSSSYTGAVTVTAGALAVTGSPQAGSVTVSGGQLQGNGTLTAPVTVNSGGAIKGGNSIGTLTVAGNLTLSAAAASPPVLVVEGNNTSNGLIKLTGAASVFNIANLTGSNQIALDLSLATGLVPGQGYSWVIAQTQDNATGVRVNGTSSFGTIPPVNYTITTGTALSNVSLVAGANTLTLNFTPVPEPGLLLVPAAVGLLAWRRRSTAHRG